jgi:hypothetical protein
VSVVVVERSFADPVEFEEIQRLEHRGTACLEAHRVRFLRTYFSRDRRRMICLYEAPDAESVRLAQQGAGVPFEAAWTSRVVPHEADVPDGEAIVVERRLPDPLDEAAILAAAARGAWCLEQRRCRAVSTFLSEDGRRVVCIFTGPDAESVRQAQKQTGMPFDVAWPARILEPGRVASGTATESARP